MTNLILRRYVHWTEGRNKKLGWQKLHFLPRLQVGFVLISSNLRWPELIASLWHTLAPPSLLLTSQAESSLPSLYAV